MHRTIGLTLTIVSLTFAAHSIVMAAIAAAQTSAPRVIEVSAKKYELTPAEIHVKKEERVELKVHSVDETHGIKIDVYPKELKIKPSRAPSLTIPKPTAKSRRMWISSSISSPPSRAATILSARNFAAWGTVTWKAS